MSKLLNLLTTSFGPSENRYTLFLLFAFTFPWCKRSTCFSKHHSTTYEWYLRCTYDGSVAVTTKIVCYNYIISRKALALKQILTRFRCMKPWDTLGSRDCLMPTRSLLLVMRPGYVWMVRDMSTPSCLIIILPLSANSQQSYLLNCFDSLVLFGPILKHCFCRRGPCTFERFVAIGTSSNEKVPCDGFTKGEDGNW